MTDLKKDIAEAEEIFNYWHIIEFLQQNDFPKENIDIQNKLTIARKASCKKIDFECSIPQNHLKEYIENACGNFLMQECSILSVYLGKINREICIKKICQLLNKEDTRPETTQGDIAYICFQIDMRTMSLIDGSVSVSPLLWAIDQLKDGEILNEDIYSRDVRRLENTIKEFFLEKISLDSILQKCYFYVVQAYILSDDLLREAYKEITYTGFATCVFYRDKKVKDTDDEPESPSLSMNFFSADIQMVHDVLKKNPSYFLDYPWKNVLTYTNVLNRSVPKRFDFLHPEECSSEEQSFNLYDAFHAIFDIQNAPLGKWPSKFRPAFMQQGAINIAIHKNDPKSPLWSLCPPVFSVNGPPGTGKTTLLKEIIVHHIVEKAILLATYKKPDDAFTKHSFKDGNEARTHAYNKFYPHFYEFTNDSIVDHEMLVTSCNNAAVENITKELPATAALLDGIGQSATLSKELAEIYDLFCQEKSTDINTIHISTRNKDNELITREVCIRDIYFSHYANNFLNENKSEGIQNTNWGLIAAPLGRRKNLRKFIYSVLIPLLKNDFYKNSSIAQHLDKYTQVRESFLAQVSRVKAMQTHIIEVSQQFDVYQNETHVWKQKLLQCNEFYDSIKIKHMQIEEALQHLQQQLESHEKEQAEFDCKNNDIFTEIAAQNTKVDLLKEKLSMCNEKIDTYYDKKGFFCRIFSPKKYAWYTTQIEKNMKIVEKLENSIEKLMPQQITLNNKFQILQKERNQNEVIHKNLLYAIHEKKADLEATINALAICEKNQLYYVSQLDLLQAKIQALLESEKLVPFSDSLFNGYMQGDILPQIQNPWISDAYDREREKLFYWSMKLTKEFLLSSKACRCNLYHLMSLWGGNDKDAPFSARDSERIADKLFQTLFLLVPVVSTTFASVHNFLAQINAPGKIGTLIVDESGQAQPQFAIGALFRARKTIVVGDPKQIEPVVTDDLAFLKDSFKSPVLQAYKNNKLSIQSFADQNNPFGTYLQSDDRSDEKEWIGWPLLVHRRCISPMFDISNAISYSGIMKLQTQAPGKDKIFLQEASTWFQIEGKEIGHRNHFVPAQGGLVCNLVQRAFAFQSNPDLFIISPFSSVVKNIKRVLLQNSAVNEQDGKMEIYKKWVQSHIGTVHTFQGKEANEVIFLLGCDNTPAAAGAIRWVNSNIVNVAVTRAKYRLYVVGDQNAWLQSIWIRKMCEILLCSH